MQYNKLYVQGTTYFVIHKGRVKCTNCPVLTLRGWIEAGVVLGGLEERRKEN